MIHIFILQKHKTKRNGGKAHLPFSLIKKKYLHHYFFFFSIKKSLVCVLNEMPVSCIPLDNLETIIL